MQATVADVNWLLSALAQATAALIAIVGGLLVSRYVTLHAEQQSAGRRVLDLARREAEADSSLATAKSNLASYRVADALDDDRVFEEFLARDMKPTVGGVLRAIESDGADLDPELLAEEIESMGQEMPEAIKSIYPLVPVTSRHATWSDFLREHSLKPVRRQLWMWVYDKACEERRREAEKAARAARNTARNAGIAGLLSAGAFSAPSIDVGSLSAARWTARSQRELAQERSLEDQVADAAARIGALRQERRLAEETYDATRQPEGFGLALQVLTFLAVVGMGVPVVLMGFAPLALPDWGRATVIGLFFLGVAMLLRFLFVYAAFLRQGGIDTLPASVFGLLR
ncbi:MAG TPA: hypothetical protein VGK53_12590 [Propionicimonas sp.]